MGAKRGALCHLAALAVLTVGLVTVLAVPAYAHYLLWNSVDTSTNPPEIRYTEDTRYDSANNYAINTWNNLPGGVTIAPDTWYTVNDLEVRDTYSTKNWAGKLVWNPGADNLWYNTRLMDGYGSNKRENTALHEWGHAHGLDHSFSGQVMYQYIVGTDTLGSHDISDYNGKW